MRANVDTKTTSAPQGHWSAKVHRLRVDLRGEFEEALARFRAAAVPSPENSARAEMIERFGPDAYRTEDLGTIAGGRWYERLIGRLRTWTSNARHRREGRST